MHVTILTNVFFQTVFIVFLASCSLLNDSCVNTLHNLLIVLSSETGFLLQTVFLFVLGVFHKYCARTSFVGKGMAPERVIPRRRKDNSRG